MTTEEKARRYDEAFKKAKDVYTYYCDDREQLRKMESIFPELKESEDENIRKDILSFAENMLKNNISKAQKDKFNSWLTWLEKQGEQKPTIDSSNLRTWEYIVDTVLTEKEGIGQYLDNPFTEEVAKKLQKRFGNIEQNTADVVRSFKVGDWIIGANNVVRIISLNDELNCYIAVTPNNEEVKIPYHFDDGQGHACSYHLWTIADAKDGDVLCCESGWTCIFKKLVNDETFSSHCFMDQTKLFYETGSECHTLSEEFVKAYNGKICPATEEQRKLFFQKMKELGYKWDVNNKQLIKLL